MNADVLQGKWTQLRGRIKKQWGRLTDDELDQVNGNLDILAGKLQERYGYQRDRVEKELDRLAAMDEGRSAEL